jgi:hypothetical protein
MATISGLPVAGEIHQFRTAIERTVGVESDALERGELRLHLLTAVGLLGGNRA